MGDLIRFVDQPTGSPSVRLDINDEVSFWVKSFKAPPPRLRRSTSANAMRDGITVGSATYDSRTLTIDLELRRAGQDAAATDIQKVWRELDRTNNWLQYQPNNLTKPVFFRTYRSDASDLEDIIAQAAMRKVTLEILAEPFALGLREQLGPFTVNNDPAAGSNPGYVDIAGVLGDVATEALYWNTTYNRAATLMAITSGAFSDLRPHQQAETMTLGVNTANPGTANDSVMSGTGTTNFVRTTFANSSWDPRLNSNSSGVITLQSGTWVVYGVVRRSDATSVIRVGVSPSSTQIPDEKNVVPQSTSRQIVRLGRYSTAAGANYGSMTLANPNWYVWASRESGTGNLDWDCFFLVPADSAMLEGLSHSTTGSAGGNNVFDGIADRTMSIFAGGNPVALATQEGPVASAGRIPMLTPDTTNRLFFLTSSQYNSSGLRVHSKTESNSLTIYYWPRYLHVRPVSS